MATRIRVEVSDPGCWYWVDATTTPVQHDPDLPQDREASAHYGSLDWRGIAKAAQWVVSRAQDASDWHARRGHVKLSHELTNEEMAIVHDWVRARPPLSTLLSQGTDRDIWEGRHRLWAAGQADVWPLPVISIEMQDLVTGLSTIESASAELEAMRQFIRGAPAVSAVNGRFLANVEAALTTY